MVKFIKDTNVLPIAKVGRVGIRAWENKDTTITYQFRITSSKVKEKTEAWRNSEKLTGRKLRTKLEDFARALQDRVVTEEEALDRGVANNISSDTNFADYVDHYFEVKKNTEKLKQSTLVRYRSIAEKCIDRFGKLKLSDIKVPEINQFYIDLNSTPKKNGKKARCIVDLCALMKPYYITQVELCTISKLSAQTVRACVKGKNIEYENAQSIYKAFNKILNDKDKIAYTNGVRSRKRKPEPPIMKVPKYNFSDLFEVVDSKKTLSGKTVWEYHQFLYSVFSLAMTESIINYNPVNAVARPKYNTPEQDVFEIEEIQQIVKTLDEEYINGRVSAKWRAIMYLLIYTGARRGEIAGLRWESIDFNNRVLDINNNSLYVHGVGTYCSTPKTKSSQRKLTIADDLLQVLADYRKDYEQNKPDKKGWNSGGYVFTQANGNPINPCSITDWCDDFSAKYNLPHIHPHAFRHSVATNLIHQNIDVVTVSHMLGHSKPSITMDIYAHAFRDNNSTACEKIADIYSNK